MQEEQGGGTRGLVSLRPPFCALGSRLCDSQLAAYPPDSPVPATQSSHHRDTAPANLSRSFDISDSAVKDSDSHILPCVAQLL